ncbi:MAG: 1-deoxy-D-xylulose-5-phosphate reductoisomerase, partial [Thermoanaerobaculales bacterium]|nr:1-deoxy-D-xylulose-5-phosphate reductoisomerase [Thermoanaerobaculales bacterium]
MKRIAVLGSTGSIGTSTLAVVEAFPENFEVVAIAAGGNLGCLRGQLKRHRPAVVSVARAEDAETLANEFFDLQILWGADGLEQIARHADADLVVVAVVGAIGLAPTLAALGAGKNVALANKETLVVAGDLVMDAARRAGVLLLPVDSEHSAIHRALRGGTTEGVARLILTASGGPFRTWSLEAIKTATRDDALKHPTWQMGAKITIDSATMMNKGLEIIEAHHFFGVPERQIDVVIHPQSLIHAMVESADGAVTAQLSANDMRLPIAYALAWPERLVEVSPPLDFTSFPALTFEAPDRDRFPALDLARAALRAGGEMPAVLSAANEVAVTAFLGGRCSFPAVATTVAETLDAWSARNRPLVDIDQALAADGEARLMAADTIMKYGAPVHG